MTHRSSRLAALARPSHPCDFFVDDARRYRYLPMKRRASSHAAIQRRFQNGDMAVATPEGKLTPAQFEIMQLIWDSAKGLTIGEIWDAIRSNRQVSRTTVLNLVDRLEKRSWLARHKDLGVYRYAAAVERQSVERQLATDFVQEFFEGSAANLVMSLLGSRPVARSDIDRLKRLLDEREAGPARKKGDAS
jgi:predicted transcriptional regulator